MARIYATLGGVEFEIPAVEELSDTIQWEYKQQETVAEKAVIQFAGAKARTMSLKIHLHASFCNPEQRKKELEDKARLIAPLPLILANGRLLGYFVISEIKSSLQKTDKDGNIIASELQLSLTESESGSAGSGGAGGGSATGLPPKPSAGAAPIQKIPASASKAKDPAAALGSFMREKQQKAAGVASSVKQSLRLP
jgi:phage protein U